MFIRIVSFDRICKDWRHTCAIIDDKGRAYENEEEKRKLHFITIMCETIPKNAFIGCSNLKVVEMDGCVRYVGKCAFSGCRFLEQVKFSPNIVRIGSWAFFNCSSLQPYIDPNDLRYNNDSYQSIFYCSSLTFEMPKDSDRCPTSSCFEMLQNDSQENSHIIQEKQPIAIEKPIDAKFQRFAGHKIELRNTHIEESQNIVSSINNMRNSLADTMVHNLVSFSLDIIEILLLITNPNSRLP